MYKCTILLPYFLIIKFQVDIYKCVNSGFGPHTFCPYLRVRYVHKINKMYEKCLNFTKNNIKLIVPLTIFIVEL